MKAKRGDIAVIVTEERTFYTNQPTETRTRVDVTEITSITREGIVKAVRNVWGGVPYSVDIHHARRSALYVVPKTDVDVPASMAAARAHTFPNSDTPMPYGSLAEVKAMLSVHRIAQAR